MSDRNQAFGQLALRVGSTIELLALEERGGRQDWFGKVDALVEHALRRALSGERLIALKHEHDQHTMAILGLDRKQRALIEERYNIAHQQARGAWFLPEEATLGMGWANLPFHYRDYPRYAMGITSEERYKIRFHGSADALFFWAVLEPLFERLFLPFQLRGPLLGKKDRDWQRKAWEETTTFFDALGFDVSEALGPMRYGGGWSKRRAHEQLEIKQALMSALNEQVLHSHAAKYRAFQVHRLLSRYYQFAKKAPPKRQQILTKEQQRTLSAFFDGDWLDFLSYIGEEPHPDERIATALPETRLVVADRERVAATAVAHGLPVEEIERALAAFWGPGQDSSPVEQRLAVLQVFWREFGAIHERQAPGMLPLWGLVDDGGIHLSMAQPYKPGLYRTLLSSDLLAKIDRFWTTCMLTRWPERIVTTLSPHALMAETFGPAVRFWHGCALTAWFVCEGPSSRTDLTGLAEYYKADLMALDRLGCPVDPSLFDELVEAEGQLGSPEPIYAPERFTDRKVMPRIELSLRFSIGTRRTGFGILRDIISRHRRMWGEQYLDNYLRSRWESEIRDAARDFHLLHERKGKPPSLKQFATHAVLATNHWFGGDVSGLYRMIGEKTPVQPERHVIMPVDREGFAQTVLERLSGASSAVALISISGGTDAVREHEQARWNLQWLAEESLSSVQREEALGRPPTLDEFGRERFLYHAAVLAPEPDTAWSIYQQAIEAAKKIPRINTDPQLSRNLRSQPHDAPTASTGANVESRTNVAAQVEQTGTEKKSFWKRLFGGDQR